MGDSEDERDREQDDYERHREREEERYRERGGDRGQTREPLSRRLTGAESQRPPRQLQRTQNEGQEVPSDATPRKRVQPAPVRVHTDPGGGARSKEPAALYLGTEPSDPRRGGQTSTRERRTYNDTRESHERRRLFDNDIIEHDGFIDQSMEAAEATSQPELDGFLTVMDKEQLVASLQHMALQWKTLQGDTTAPAPSGKDLNDSHRQQPTTATHTAATITLTPRARRYMARDRAVSPPTPPRGGHP